jgi:hypothetical protein
MGYKRRNAQLDAMDGQVASKLNRNSIPLANKTFENIKDVKLLRQLHSHLPQKYVLLGKVIDARKLHHTHFYPPQVDYGHQTYLHNLSNQRHIVLGALRTLEKKTADVLFREQAWFAWVRQVQEEEEANRVQEQKRSDKRLLCSSDI